MKRFLIATVCSVVLAAQAGAPTAKLSPPKAPIPTPTPMPQTVQDPVAEFKALVANASNPTQWSNVWFHKNRGKWVKQYYSLGPVKYDVKKTDSLVHPAKGVVFFPIEVTQSDFFDSEAEADQSTTLSNIRVTYYYSGEYLSDEGKWLADHFTYYSAIGDNPPDRSIKVTLGRDQLLKDAQTGTGFTRVLDKWIR